MNAVDWCVCEMFCWFVRQWKSVCKCGIYFEMVVCVHELQCGLPPTAKSSSCRILARMFSCANSVFMASTCVRLRSLSKSILLWANAHPTAQTTHTHVVIWHTYAGLHVHKHKHRACRVHKLFWWLWLWIGLQACISCAVQLSSSLWLSDVKMTKQHWQTETGLRTLQRRVRDVCALFLKDQSQIKSNRQEWCRTGKEENKGEFECCVRPEIRPDLGFTCDHSLLHNRFTWQVEACCGSPPGRVGVRLRARAVIWWCWVCRRPPADRRFLEWCRSAEFPPCTAARPATRHLPPAAYLDSLTPHRPEPGLS